MQSCVAKRMGTGPPFSCKMKSEGAKNTVFGARKSPIPADSPSRKASPAGWIAKRKPSEADDTNIPHIFLYLWRFTTWTHASAPRATPPCAYAFCSSWRGPHKLHRRASLFFAQGIPKGLVIGCGGFIATVW